MWLVTVVTVPKQPLHTPIMYENGFSLIQTHFYVRPSALYALSHKNTEIVLPLPPHTALLTMFPVPWLTKLAPVVSTWPNIYKSWT